MHARLRAPMIPRSQRQKLAIASPVRRVDLFEESVMVTNQVFSAQPSQITATLRQLQEDTLPWTLPGLYLAGFLLLATARAFAEPLAAGLPALLLFLLPIIVWTLLPWRARVAAWTLIAGCLLVCLLLAAWSGVVATVVLLAIPAGLATLFLGPLEGMLMALLCSLLFVGAPPAWMPADGALRAIAALNVWGAVGLAWLAWHPLRVTTRWFWSMYEQDRSALERAREYQVQLGQTLEDLADANLQLTRLNRVAEAMRQLAEDARRAKEQFVANVSHELRTPLNMIIGFSEMIIQSPETYGAVPASLLADLTIVLRNSQHLSSLIDDVLDLSQIEAGQMALARERVSLAEVIEAATVAVQPLFNSKGLYLKTEVADSLPPVFCDRTRVRQVILNLLSNAGRFTEQGGVRIRAWQEGGEVVVSVADTGPGIPAAERGRLFQPFQQLDGSLRRRHGGSGLGLSISKSFVEMHGGKMWLESEPGQGTTFFFRLPIDPPVPSDPGAMRWFNPYMSYEQRSRRSLAVPAVVRPRLVVCERGDSLRRLLARYLEGVEIATADDLSAAMDELERAPAQALIINTTTVTQGLAQLEAHGPLPYGTPTLICAIPEIYEVAQALEVSTYLVKPVTRAALLAALDRLDLKGKTLLVVDDDQEAQRLFRRMLASSRRGYRVLRASEGQEALAILREQRPDAVLLDLMMPGMDGFHLLALKRQDPALRDIPVIILSARDPASQPIVSKAVAITQADGISAQQLLGYIQRISGIAQEAALAASTGRPGMQSG